MWTVKICYNNFVGISIMQVCVLCETRFALTSKIHVRRYKFMYGKNFYYFMIICSLIKVRSYLLYLLRVKKRQRGSNAMGKFWF